MVNRKARFNNFNINTKNSGSITLIFIKKTMDGVNIEVRIWPNIV